MLTIIYKGQKITGEVKDIYEFIKLIESEVVVELTEEKISDTLAKLGYEIEVDEPDILKAKKQNYQFDYKTYFVIDFNKNEVQKYISDNKISRNDVLLNAEEVEFLDTAVFGKDNWKKIEKMDKETADEVKEFGECGGCVKAWRDGVPCPDKDSYCPYKKQNCAEKGMKDFYQSLSEGECYLVCDIKNLKDTEVESVDFVGTYDSEHNEGQ